jgi:hypothetical protein
MASPRLPARLRRLWTRRRPAPWRSAGILLTYACNAECADCYENCGPGKRGVLPLEDLRGYLRELKRLGLGGRALHFGGGEPFYHYRHLIACLEVARQEGMLPLGKLETNAFWCKSDDVARQRLGELAAFGIETLLVSCDAFHQEFVPIERVRRLVRIGREVLGERAVRVSVPEFLRDPIDVAALGEERKLEAFRDALGQAEWRMVGRAARRLAPLVKRRPLEAFAGARCARKLLAKRSIHVDPYGNVFPSVCAGIVLGNARRRPLSGMPAAFDLREHPLLRTLVEAGPAALMQEAIARGCEPPAGGFASKCHACFEARRFFHEHTLYPAEVGPAEIYRDGPAGER